MSARKAEEEYAIAGDGLLARRNGAWARDKLSFLDEFLPPALQATIRKKQRYYVDLFAGPGKNVDDEGTEFEGAALRALKLHAQSNGDIGFTNAVLVNLDAAADAALKERVENHCADGHCLVPLVDVQFRNDDANEVVAAIMRGIHELAYVFVFADIEKPNQLPFDTVRVLKGRGHKSIDFCVLFPDDMALRRMLPYGREKLRPNIPALNRYLGTETWIDLWEARKSQAQSPDLYRAIQDLYADQLRSLGWQYVVETRYVRREGDAGLYKLLLASDSKVAEKFAKWSAQKERNRQQPELDFDP
jgi:three-Cys-motif partner protein